MKMGHVQKAMVEETLRETTMMKTILREKRGRRMKKTERKIREKAGRQMEKRTREKTGKKETQNERVLKMV